MKSRIHIFILLTAMASFLGCSDDNNDIEPTQVTITCSSHELSFGSDADTTTVDISVTNEWTIYSSEDWVSCSPSSSINTSETVSVFVKQNSYLSDRTAILVVKSGSTRDTITVSQEADTSTDIDTLDGYSLVWHDEFETGISSDWIFETGNGSSGWGNNELEYYLEDNATVSDGVLEITAKKESYEGYSYTSARMKTMGNQYWTYGKIEARIKLPSFSGSWPAFWMLGENYSDVGWPSCGEIDIMEHINTESLTYGTIHWYADAYASYSGNTTVDDVTSYHVYSIEWDESSIKWYVDDVQYHEASIEDSVNGTDEFHKDFFILLNFAIGGDWPGFTVDENAFPATMYVDYVRVFQKE
jgi:beta-glucanase (GH16 family)